MSPRRLFLVPLLLAAGLRSFDLAARPMHADEAVHADKFGTLLEGGGYAYDPREFHGPTLYYLTLIPAWLRGEERYLDIDEVTLRSVPAVLGLLLVGAHFAARRWLGAPAAFLAALLAAVSPAMVFYSRYYIHEMLLVAASFGALRAAARYLEAPSAHAAVICGVWAGLMVATKETATIALLCLLTAFVLASRGEDPPVDSGKAMRDLPTRGRHLVLALLAAVVVAGLLFSSFLTRPSGLLDAVRAYGFYLDRAQTAEWHVHPWWYYLELLVRIPPRGMPSFSEALILVLAGIGLFAARGRSLRFLGFYTLLMLVSYSAIPYKTPWCVLSFLHGLILLAGVGGAWLLRRLRTRKAATAALTAFLVLGTSHLGWQAWRASGPLSSDPRNPWVYAHTGPDVFLIAGRVREMARAHGDGIDMKVQIMSRENLWPLPFYLRGLKGIAWWTGVPPDGATSNAPVVLVSPELEAGLVRRLYDLPPPGERELYLSLFERPVFLRPGVEIRGFATGRLVEQAARAPAQGGRE